VAARRRVSDFASAGVSFVLADTRSDSRRLVERSVLMSDLVRRRSFSPSSSAWRRERFASAFCRNTSALDVGAVRYHRSPDRLDQPAARRLNDALFFAERDTVELVEHHLMEALANSVRLRALDLGARVIDVLDREIEFVFAPLRVAAIFADAIGEHAQQLDSWLSKYGTTRSLRRSAAVIGVLRGDSERNRPPFRD
jgi:hypothetical protein